MDQQVSTRRQSSTVGGGGTSNTASGSQNPLEKFESFKSNLPDNLSYDDEWCFPEQLSQEDGEYATSQQQEWYKNSGHLIDAELVESYSGYDEYTLQELASGGDVTAFSLLSQVLSDQRTNIIEKGNDRKAVLDALAENTERRRAVNIDAAVYGSSKALNELGLTELVLARRYLKEDNRGAALSSLVKGLAYYENAYKLGDYTSFGVARDFLWKHIGMEITPELLSEVSSVAEQIAEDIENRRTELGVSIAASKAPKIVRQMTAYRMYIDSLDQSDPWTTKIVREFPDNGCKALYQKMYSKHSDANDYLANQ